MKTISSVVMFLILAASATAQQSVADAARKARAEKRSGTATIRLDGDSTPRLATATVSSSEPEKAKDTNQPADSKDQAKAPPKPKADDWAKKIEEQKKEIATLQRELDVVQREQRLRAAAFYADAGTQLRDQAKFAEDSRKEQAEIDAKKQALAEAQQKLEDLQEAARKAGSPTS